MPPLIAAVVGSLSVRSFVRGISNLTGAIILQSGWMAIPTKTPLETVHAMMQSKSPLFMRVIGGGRGGNTGNCGNGFIAQVRQGTGIKYVVSYLKTKETYGLKRG